jgi:hypothetical protein
MARTAAKSAAAKSTAFVHVKVTLQYIRPPIWRRLLLPDTTNLGNLSEIIQAAMGWHGGHLHAFEIGGEQFGDPSMTDFVRNERKTTIRSLLRDDVSRFGYTYDFGDSWEHDILIEKKGPPPDAPRSPACVAGKRNCPPEDCGGPPGYDALLEALAAPESPEAANCWNGSTGTTTRRNFRSMRRTHAFARRAAVGEKTRRQAFVCRPDARRSRGCYPAGRA